MTRKAIPLDALRCCRGVFWQNPYLCPAVLILPGLILAKSLAAPRYPGIDGAYYGKILIYTPMARQRRGLFQQNPYLRPDGTTTPGLIPAKSLSTPRCPGIDGAYYGKILIYTPMARQRRGLFQQNPYLRPDGTTTPGLIPAKSLSAPRCPSIDGAYYGKILICAPMYKGGGYNRPDFVSHTRIRKFCWVQIACF